MSDFIFWRLCFTFTSRERRHLALDTQDESMLSDSVVCLVDICIYLRYVAFLTTETAILISICDDYRVQNGD